MKRLLGLAALVPASLLGDGGLLLNFVRSKMIETPIRGVDFVASLAFRDVWLLSEAAGSGVIRPGFRGRPDSKVRETITSGLRCRLGGLGETTAANTS